MKRHDEYNNQELYVNNIQEHSLEVEDSTLDHDSIIRIQAHNLMTAGYLEYEAAAYGVAYLEKNNVSYYICESEIVMDKFLKQCLENGVFTTPVKYYYRRYDLLTESPEQINNKFRYYIAKKLQNEFPKNFFDAVQDLTVNKVENRAFPFMKELTFQLDSCFNIYQLEIFNGLLEFLVKARQLSIEGYQILKEWLIREYDKFIDDIKVGRYKKQYSGFAYEDQNGNLKYFCDAYPYMAKEKQVKLLSKGLIVTPILSKNIIKQLIKDLRTIVKILNGI